MKRRERTIADRFAEYVEFWDAWDRFWASDWGLAVFVFGFALILVLAVTQ